MSCTSNLLFLVGGHSSLLTVEYQQHSVKQSVSKWCRLYLREHTVSNHSFFSAARQSEAITIPFSCFYSLSFSMTEAYSTAASLMILKHNLFLSLLWPKTLSWISALTSWPVFKLPIGPCVSWLLPTPLWFYLLLLSLDSRQAQLVFPPHPCQRRLVLLWVRVLSEADPVPSACPGMSSLFSTLFSSTEAIAIFHSYLCNNLLFFQLEWKWYRGFAYLIML